MDKQEFTNRMKEHDNEFDLLWSKIVADVNNFKTENPNATTDDLNFVSKIADNLCLSGAWIIDRINGKSGLPSNITYRGSLTKRIRKALGYTY